MKTISNIRELRSLVAEWRRQQQKIAFVPTMGNLHDGHLTLIKEAKKRAEHVVVSIFVNPMQFNDANDLANYPRTEQQDSAALRDLDVDILFLPTVETIYPTGIDQQTRVEVPEISTLYCGSSRPGHFLGVTTVVTKLFNLVNPDIAVFGEKDFQQLFIIRRMVEELCMDVEIVGIPTVREESGLAMSSRNNYLNNEQHQVAPVVYQSLSWLKHELEQGNTNFEALEDEVRTRFDDAGLTSDYVHILNSKTLKQAQPGDAELVIIAAAWCGKARLIDNITVEVSR